MRIARRILAVSALATLALLPAGCGTERETAQQIEPTEPTEPEKPEKATSKTGRLAPEELLELAREKAAGRDPDAFPVRLEYNWGNREMAFREAEVVFSSPVAARRGESEDAVHVSVENGRVVQVKAVAWGRAEEVQGENVLPQRPIKIALGHGLEAWWKRYPGGSLFAEVRPRDHFREADLPGTGRWVWKILGSGPGVPVDCLCYIEAGTLRFLKQEFKQVGKETTDVPPERVEEKLPDLRKIIEAK